MGTILKSSLVGELYKFGLNPKDWHIEKDQTGENQYLLINRTDPEFKIRGSVEFPTEQKIQWTELSLTSF